MTGAPTDLCRAVDEANRQVPGAGLRLEWRASTASTMDVASAAAEAGASAGLVVVADAQSGGRGRRGRPWSSPTGAGLYVSLLLRPDAEVATSVLPALTLATGVAVREAVRRATGLETHLKWPNDVMVGARKLAGILAESGGLGGPAPHVVLGIGINLKSSAHPPEFAHRVTSIETETNTNTTASRGDLLREVLVAIVTRYDLLRTGQLATVLTEWLQGAPTAQGAAIEWRDEVGPHRGVTAGVNALGQLQVRDDTGVRTIPGGEIVWLL